MSSRQDHWAAAGVAPASSSSSPPLLAALGAGTTVALGGYANLARAAVLVVLTAAVSLAWSYQRGRVAVPR